MKLLHVVASYLPAVRYGGPIVSVHGLCTALARRGHDVHVATTSVDGPGDSAVPLGVPVSLDDVSVWYFPSTRLRRFYWAPQLRETFRKLIGSFDVVHTHGMFLWPPWSAIDLARAAAVPYVMSPRGMMEKGLIEQRSTLAKAALIAFQEKPRLEAAAAIHVTSSREAEELRRFGFNLRQVYEIPNGVSMAQIPDGMSPAVAAIIARGAFALYLGRINWKKGLDRLLMALPYAPGLRLVIAGADEGGYRHVIEELAARLEVAGRVTFAGDVREGDKSALLRSATFLVLSSYSENFGNVVLESFAHGRPVIVTREVGLAPLVQAEDAGTVSDGTPAALGSALMAMTHDRQACERQGQNGRRLVEQRFQWPVVARQMEALYEGVVAR